MAEILFRKFVTVGNELMFVVIIIGNAMTISSCNQQQLLRVYMESHNSLTSKILVLHCDHFIGPCFPASELK